MNATGPRRWILWLSISAATLLIAVSLAGMLSPWTYIGETGIRAAEYAGNDVGNLAFIVPVLLVSSWMAFRASIAAHLVWMGALAYLVYDFLGYSLGVRFNPMFLADCGIVALSFYALMGGLLTLPIPETVRRAPVKTTAGVLMLVGAATVLHWLWPILHILLTGWGSPAARDSGTLTEPVAVLDLSLAGPACLVAGIPLLRRRPIGFAVGAIMLTFLALSSLVLVPMGLSMARRSFESGYSLCAVGLGVATASTALLALCLRDGGAESRTESG